MNKLQTHIPLVAHIVYSFDVGGLENGVVNLINNSNPAHYRHVIICLSHYTDFFHRIQRDDVEIYALKKKPGNDMSVLFRFFRLLKKIKPDIVHTRNIATLESQLPTLLAGIKGRIHGEHGWDMGDISGKNKKYRLLRRFFVPMVKQYIALSLEGADYLRREIHIPEKKINHIYNGVDTLKFSSNNSHNDITSEYLPKNFLPENSLVFGTVGRMAEVKNQLFFIRAFLELIQTYPQYQTKARLVLVGDGILMQPAQLLVEDFCSRNHCENQLVFFAGKSDQADQYLRLMDVFVLPSLAEGISNTILEAMATSLPVIATDVGGNSDLVVENETGFIIPVNNIQKLTQVMKIYIDNERLRLSHGLAGRRRITEHFSMQKMVSSYEQVYEKVLN